MPVQDIAAPVVRLGAEGERIELGGGTVIFKSPVDGQRRGWMAVEQTMAPRQPGPPLHYHQKVDESFYVISGELWMRVGDREVIAGPGSYIQVPAGTLHTFSNRSGAPVRFLGHSSDPKFKDFLLEVFELIRNEPAWPPSDPAKLAEIGRRYDTYYL